MFALNRRAFFHLAWTPLRVVALGRSARGAGRLEVGVSVDGQDVSAIVAVANPSQRQFFEVADAFDALGLRFGL